MDESLTRWGRLENPLGDEHARDMLKPQLRKSKEFKDQFKKFEDAPKTAQTFEYLLKLCRGFDHNKNSGENMQREQDNPNILKPKGAQNNNKEQNGKVTPFKPGVRCWACNNDGALCRPMH